MFKGLATFHYGITLFYLVCVCESMPFQNNSEYDSPSNTNNDLIECLGNLCKTRNYPESDIAKALANNPNLDLMFENEMEINEISNRQLDGQSVILRSFCSSTQSHYFPTVGKTINNEEKIIININGKLQSAIVETCDDPGEVSRLLEDNSFPYRTECVQKKTTRKFVTYHKGVIAQDEFEIFSACHREYYEAPRHRETEDEE